MKRTLLVLGAGGHGRVVADAALLCGYEEVDFLDDAAGAFSGKSVGASKIVGGLHDFPALVPRYGSAIVAIGKNDLRLNLFRQLASAGYQTPAIVHPRAVVSGQADIAGGVFVAAGVVVNPGATVGEAAIVNTNATVEHDCTIGAGAHISPGAQLAGNVSVGERAWIGLGALVRNGVGVGADAVIGMGAVVLGDVPPGATVAGVPAKPLDRNRERIPNC